MTAKSLRSTPQMDLHDWVLSHLDYVRLQITFGQTISNSMLE